MFTEDCPFKVVRTNGGDEVLARAANLLIDRAAFETAKEIANKSPDAIRAAKRLLNLAVATDAKSGLTAESVEQQKLIGSPNQLEAIAANLQKRDGVETIVLAGTDLTVMFDEQTAGFPCLDVARLHIDAIVARLAAPEHR